LQLTVNFFKIISNCIIVVSVINIIYSKFFTIFLYYAQLICFQVQTPVSHHPDRAEEPLDELQADYEAVLHQSQESHERGYKSDLTKRLEVQCQLLALDASKCLMQFHLYGHIQLNFDAQSVLFANSL
jgi:hypothetical protein